MEICLVCGRERQRWSSRYCSNKCQWQHQYEAFIQKWRAGTVSGNRGINTKNISQHLKRFLVEKYGERCSVCGWNERHPLTDNVPLEVDHMDGNADNNHEDNLRLVCPNCHSLTSTFRNLNKGNGRAWRNGTKMPV